MNGSAIATLSRIRAVFVARSLEYFRDHASVIRNVLMPLVLIVILAYSFTGGQQPLFKAAVLSNDGKLPSVSSQPFLDTPLVQFYAERNASAAVRKVQLQQIDILVDFSGHRFWVNDLSRKGLLLQRTLLASRSVAMQRERVTGTQARYVDWVVPGVLGLNIILASLFGIGNVIVAYRKSGYLKRLSVTPLRPAEFLMAQLASRVCIVLTVNAFIFAVCHRMLHLRMEGSYAELLLLTLLGIVAVAGISLFISSRFNSDELVTGILNLVFATMMLVSGAFFSLDGAPRPLRLLAELSPLTHLLAGARAIMLEGAGFAQIGNSFLALAAMSAGWMLAASLAFRWRDH